MLTHTGLLGYKNIYRGRLIVFLVRFNIKSYLLPFLQGSVPLTGDTRKMDKHIFSAFFVRDKTVTLSGLNHLTVPLMVTPISAVHFFKILSADK